MSADEMREGLALALYESQPSIRRQIKAFGSYPMTTTDRVFWRDRADVALAYLAQQRPDVEAVLKPGDLTVMADWLVEYAGEHTCGDGEYGAHEPGCGYVPLINLAGMSPVERVAVTIDATAALGTPEVVYRKEPGETIAEAAARLRAEVMQMAADVLRVAALPPAAPEVVETSIEWGATDYHGDLVGWWSEIDMEADGPTAREAAEELAEGNGGSLVTRTVTPWRPTAADRGL